MSLMQEMNSRVEKTSNELVKFTTENVALEIDYNKVKQECDEAKQKVERMQLAFEKLYQEIPKVQVEKEASIEDQVIEISESIQGFRKKKLHNSKKKLHNIHYKKSNLKMHHLLDRNFG
jgi:archaellum component FlaC